MVQSIRVVEQVLGDGIKRPTTSEQFNLPIVRKSLVASQEIKTEKLSLLKMLQLNGREQVFLDELGRFDRTHCFRDYCLDEQIEW